MLPVTNKPAVQFLKLLKFMGSVLLGVEKDGNSNEEEA